MLKNIFGVIAGFVLWSAFWVVSDVTLAVISPEWYGSGMQNATTAYLLIAIARSVFISFVAGYVAALIARREQILTGLALGVVLLAFGVFVQISVWNKIPLWYHIVFLALLIPATWFGAKMRTPQTV